MTNRTNIFSFFEDIVCINLDISVDRRKHSEHYFDKLNIPARFYTATKHPDGGVYGCFHSHIQVLKAAYEQNLNNILVFEDDFLPTAAYSEEKLQTVIDFMKSNDDWDIMHLGYIVIKDDNNGVSTIFDAKHVSEDIVQYNACCTDALCYSKRAIKKIIVTYEDYLGTMHYDRYLSAHADLKNYCVLPMIFDQNFYFQYNVQPCDAIEYALRFIFPFFAFTNINYRLTVLKYFLNKYKNITHYTHLIIFSILLYRIKTALLLYVQKKNICTK